MFSAYFDESGTKHEGQIFTVAGGVAPVNKWVAFDGHWRRILADNDLASFHMKDLYRNRNQFKGWEGKSEKKAKLLADLANCVRRNVNKTISASIVLRDWNIVNEAYRLVEEIGNPYPFCRLACVAYVRQWARRHNDPLLASTEFFFEDGAENKGELDSLCKKDQQVKPIFLPKGKAPFEMGDLVAWESRRQLTDLLEIQKFDMRPSLAIIRKAADSSKVFTRPQIVELCELAGTSKRSPIRATYPMIKA